MSYALQVADACESQALVGGELRAQLARDIPAKVLLRKARDVVLLTGATGSGKEKIAAVCHAAARKALGRGGDLIEVNCANLSGSLFESELFGHKRGAFTGADREFAGLVGKAQGGTLVLDEIQSLEPANQARLLRFIGEREFRAVGDDKVRTTDALIILSSNQNLQQRVREGTFRRDLLDRASAKINVPALWERRADVGELAQAFALEAAADVGAEDFMGLTRRARADVETAVVRAQEVSVRRLREIVRDAVFIAAADELPDAIESEIIVPVLERELAYDVNARDAQDMLELEHGFDFAVAHSRLAELTKRHGISPRALNRLCGAIQSLIADMGDQPRSYRNVVERTNRLSKVALWLVSGAKTQAEFRKYFGTLEADMPTKSVAHQVFYDVFPKDGDA